MKYKVIFFDADGVILKGGVQFTDELNRKFGLKIENMEPFFKGRFLDCAAGRADVKEELAKVITDWGWKGTVDELMHFWLSEGTVFDEENIQLARQISEKGVHCFVSTGQEKYRGDFIKNKVGYGHPFEDVFYSAELGCSKGDILFFEIIFDRVRHITQDKSSILMIDDSPRIIEAAKEFGFDTIFYQKPEDLNELRASI